MPDIRVRRLETKDNHPYRIRKPIDLFSAARKREPIRDLEIGIHLGGIRDADSMSAFLLQVLTGRGRPKSPRFWAREAPMPPFIDPVHVTRFEIKEETDELAVATHQTETTSSSTAIHGRRNWGIIAELLFRDPSRVADLLELGALASVGSDFVITQDPAFLASRNHQALRGLNLVTPEEAFVIAGVWSRLTHGAYVAGPNGTNVGLYYQALSRALLPAATPALRQLSDLQMHSPKHRELFDLILSIRARFEATGRALDQMAAVWQCDADNDTIAELLDDFDRVILNSWAIYDNVALVLTRRFDMTIRDIHISPLNRTWISALKAAAGATVVADLVSSDRHALSLKASHQVRHQLIHRAHLTPLRVGRGPHLLDEYLVILEGDELVANLVDAIDRLGQELIDWGVRNVLDDHTQEIHEVGPSGEERGSYTIERERQAWVDPLTFALRVAAHSASFANGVLELLYQDEAVSAVEPAGPLAESFSPRGMAAAILSSPLAGLVDTPSIMP